MRAFLKGTVVLDQTPGQPITFKNSGIEGIQWGSQKAPLLIALHGWMDNAASFSRIAPILAEQLAVRIIAIDFSGHGLSHHRPPRSEYSIWSYCHDVLDVLDELGIPEIWLMGHSLGAGVSNILAATVPERVKGLILIDGLLGRLVEPEQLAEQLRKGISSQRREPTLKSKRYVDINEAVVDRVRKSLLPITEATAMPIVARNLKGDSEQGLQLRIDRQVSFPRPVAFTEAQAIGILSKISCPCLLIRAKKGIISERDPNKNCRNAIQRLTIMDVPGGHHAHLEEYSSTLVADAILVWANKHLATWPQPSRIPR